MSEAPLFVFSRLTPICICQTCVDFFGTLSKLTLFLRRFSVNLPLQVLIWWVYMCNVLLQTMRLAKSIAHGHLVFRMDVLAREWPTSLPRWPTHFFWRDFKLLSLYSFWLKSVSFISWADKATTFVTLCYSITRCCWITMPDQDLTNFFFRTTNASPPFADALWRLVHSLLHVYLWFDFPPWLPVCFSFYVFFTWGFALLCFTAHIIASPPSVNLRGKSILPDTCREPQL